MLAVCKLTLHSGSWKASCCLQIFEWVKEHGGEPIIPFSGILEAKIFDMPDDEKATYLKEVSLHALAFCTASKPRQHRKTYAQITLSGMPF